jgi:hypothetical protein
MKSLEMPIMKQVGNENEDRNNGWKCDEPEPQQNEEQPPWKRKRPMKPSGVAIENRQRKKTGDASASDARSARRISDLKQARVALENAGREEGYEYDDQDEYDDLLKEEEQERWRQVAEDAAGRCNRTVKAKGRDGHFKKKDVRAATRRAPSDRDGNPSCDCINHGDLVYCGDELLSLHLRLNCPTVGRAGGDPAKMIHCHHTPVALQTGPVNEAFSWMHEECHVRESSWFRATNCRCNMVAPYCSECKMSSLERMQRQHASGHV